MFQHHSRMFQHLSQKSKRAVAVLFMAVGLACPVGAVTINGAGATFPQPIYAKWFFSYHDTHPEVNFNYQGVGSGAGIAQYKAGTVDFGATDAPLADADLATMPQPTLQIPTVAGAVVLAYHIQGMGPGLRLSGDVIVDIYLGKIKTWNDPRITKQNPGLAIPATPISVVHRADGSGTTNIFTNYLSSVSSEWRASVGAGKSVNWPIGLGGKGNPGVAGIVLQTDGGIGYVELAYALQEHLAYGPIRNRSGNYVLASVASTGAAIEGASSILRADLRTPFVNSKGVNAYPICGFTYLLIPRVWKDAAKGRAFVDFLLWAIGPGQQLAGSLLYTPLPQFVAAVDQGAVRQVRVALR